MSHLLPNVCLNNKYLITKTLSSGGFGIVYLVMNIEEGKPYVIKELFVSAANWSRNGNNVIAPSNGQFDLKYFKDNAINEVNTLIKCSTIMGVVKVYEHFEENNTFYFVMEYIEDCITLQNFVISQNKLNDKQARDVLLPLLQTLENIHTLGILHRDIKPDNILLDSSRKPIIIDFGIAREYQEQITQTHTAIGTYGYMAPEQNNNKTKRSKSSDVYSLGGVLFFMITGNHPNNPQNVINSYKKDDILKNIAKKAMSLKPEHRFESCSDIIRCLKGQKKLNIFKVRKEKNTFLFFKEYQEYFGLQDEFGETVVNPVFWSIFECKQGFFCIEEGKLVYNEQLFAYRYFFIDKTGSFNSLWYSVTDLREFTGFSYFPQREGPMDFKVSSPIYSPPFFSGFEKEGFIRITHIRNDYFQVFGLINFRGEEILPCIYGAIRYFSEDLAAVLSIPYGWGYINSWGYIVIDCQFEAAHDFKDGKALVKSKNGASYYIDKKGNIVS